MEEALALDDGQLATAGGGGTWCGSYARSFRWRSCSLPTSETVGRGITPRGWEGGGEMSH